jgi:pyruvate dehydrogenase E2 component (dihydrolipoamide acetyltransferase)
VAWGLADAILPAAEASDLPAAVALHRLPGVGHMPQAETPDLVGRLVTETVRSAG